MFTSQAQIVVENVYQRVKGKKGEYQTPEDLLLELLSSEEGEEIFARTKINLHALKNQLIKYIDRNTNPMSIAAEPVKTRAYNDIIDDALTAAATQKRSAGISDLFVSIYDNGICYASKSLREKIKRVDLVFALTGHLHKNFIDAFSNEDENEDDEETEEQPVIGNALQLYTVDLTEQARNGKLKPYIGGGKIIKSLIKILCCKYKSNPILVAEPGEGKTASVEGLAQHIAANKVPKKIRDHKILSLDMTALIAGSSLHGVFESRLKNVVKQLKETKAFLFIDEIHTLIGAGRTQDSVIDAANILKPVLTSGEVHVIGATTHGEYDKYFEKDRALSRRFQKIVLTEPTEEEALEILKGLKAELENHHKVEYSDESLKAAVSLTVTHIPERRLPDKAIDIMDQTGASMVLVRHERKINEDHVMEIDTKTIEKEISKIARIPERTVAQDDRQKLFDLENILKEKIFWQNDAIEAVVKAVKRSRAGFRAAGKPVANFLFAGPTGVGKTELARQLAEVLGVAMLRFDMSEYQEKYSVSRLIGSSPGYIGYEDGGQLTDAVRKQPHAVVLLDEIEKAHHDIYNILLQIMDYATLTDNQGRKADFRNAILIMTSNAGARDIGKGLIGFGDRVHDESAIDSAVEKIFTPEFRGRLDAVIQFKHLSRDIMVSIVQKEIDAFALQLEEKNVTLKVTQSCIERLAQDGYSREFGARNMSRLFEEKIKTPFVDEVLFGRLSEGGSAVVDFQDGKYFMYTEKKEKKPVKNKVKKLLLLSR